MALSNAERQAEWRARQREREVDTQYAVASVRDALRPPAGGERDPLEGFLAAAGEMPEGLDAVELLEWLAQGFRAYRLRMRAVGVGEG